MYNHENIQTEIEKTMAGGLPSEEIFEDMQKGVFRSSSNLERQKNAQVQNRIELAFIINLYVKKKN